MGWAHGPAGFQLIQLFQLSGAPQTIEIIELIEVSGRTPEPHDFN